MPRYVFDVDDGERRTHDQNGICLQRMDDVEREPRLLLQNLGVPEVLHGRDRLLTALVRNQDGVTVYSATLALKIDRHPS